MNPSELPAYLASLRLKVQEQGPSKAAYAIGKAYHRALTDDTLTRYSHTRETPTTSPPGEPPALVGGHLRRSVRLYPAVSTGPATARSKVVPLIVYARIQELGGTVVAHGGGVLHWKSGGSDHFAKSVTLPPRPYMRPTHRRTIQDGTLRKAAIEALNGLVP